MFCTKPQSLPLFEWSTPPPFVGSLVGRYHCVERRGGGSVEDEAWGFLEIGTLRDQLLKECNDRAFVLETRFIQHPVLG